MRRLVACALALVVAACGQHSAYHCNSAVQCVDHGTQGSCEPEGFCAFPDGACPSGQRFEPNAGNGLGGQCVPASDVDGGLPACGEVGMACCPGATPCIANGYCGGGTCQQCVVDVAVGKRHVCAVKHDGTVWCAGENFACQLGIGVCGGIDMSTWMQVRDSTQSPITDATAIASGENHSCVLRAGGNVWCWGKDDDGQTGNGMSGTAFDLAQQATRASDSAPLSGMAAIYAADDSTCSLDGSGVVWCWGQNDVNQLGDGTVTARSRAAPVLAAAMGAPFSGVATVAMGEGDHNCLRTTANEIYCWGKNTNGAVGNNTTTNQSVPVHVFDGSSVASGQSHTCAVKGDGTVWCWGNGGRGRLGRGIQEGDLLTPVPTFAKLDGTPFGGVATVATGGVSCAVTTAGDPYCWGTNPHGQTGTGVGTYLPMPVQRADGKPLHGVARIIANLSIVCAFLADGELLCWGRNDEGELGDGTFTSRAFAAPLTLGCTS